MLRFRDVISDPDFHALPLRERLKVLVELARRSTKHLFDSHLKKLLSAVGNGTVTVLLNLSILATIGIVLFVAYHIATSLYDAAGQRTLTPEESKTKNPTVEWMYAVTLAHLPLEPLARPTDEIRLVPKTGGVLEIYLGKKDFETIPFPDRKGFIEEIGKVWCGDKSNVDELLPTLSLYDIRTGDRVGKYSCMLSHVWLP